MILILSYPLLILEVLWWVDGENKNLKGHWTGRSFTKKPWQEVSTLYMYILCKAWFSFLWQKHIEMHQKDRLAKSHDFVVHASLMISRPVSDSHKLQLISHAFLKSQTPKFWSFRVPDSQINPKKMLSGHVWLHSATKCADFLFLLFQDGCQQNTGQNVESTKCKL